MTTEAIRIVLMVLCAGGLAIGLMLARRISEFEDE